MSTPAGYYSDSEDTANGTVYYYNTTQANIPVMISAIRLQTALGILQYGDSSETTPKIRMNAKSYPNLMTNAIVLTAAGVTAAATAVSAVGTIAGAAGTAASAGTSLASLFGVGKAKEETYDTVQFSIHNNTGTPIVLYSYPNSQLTTVSAIKPLLPGTSETLVAHSESGGFISGGPEIHLTFLVGGGVISENGQPTEFKPISANVKYSYTQNGSWAPNYHIDGGEKTFEDSNQGLSAAYFMANEGSKALDFTIAAFTLEKSSALIDIVILPGSASLT